MANNIILITGCQRSGTTLMNLILDSHPDIYCIDEDKFSIWLLNSYIHMQYGKPYLSFKLPRAASMLSFIKDLPDARVLYHLRDPLDVVHSMVKLKIKFENTLVSWAAHPACAQSEITNGIWILDDDVRERLHPHIVRFSEISRKHPQERNREECILSGALCWAIKNEIPAVYDAEGISYHIIRYEDLVTAPRDIIADALDYIGIRWDDNVLRHHELHQGRSIGLTSNTRKIDNRSVAQGKSNFNADEIALIQSVCGDTADKWHYPITAAE